jgi:hypothetical protein
MNDSIARLIRDATAPLAATLAQAVARGIVALCLILVALAALGAAVVVGDIALYRWLETLVSPAVALLIVAGSWVVVALVCLIVAWALTRGKSGAQTQNPKTAFVPDATAQQAHELPDRELPDHELAELVEPLAKSLADLGLRNESVALLAGAQLFRSLKTTQLAALALVAGYVAGRVFMDRNRTGDGKS